jgi:peptidyl-prolyl cis-trans isomerase B (cyclophilin B)
MPRTALALVAALLCVGCGHEPAETGSEAVRDPVADSEALGRIREAPHDVAVITLRDLGSIRIELLPEIAPETVANFIKLSEQGFYDGTYFHRVIPGFMIQGGDPNTKNNDPRDDGQGNPGYTIPDEFTDYPHRRGTVSMANAGSIHSGGSQFFIVHADSFALDRGYAAFGRVTQGMEVVDAVTRLEIDVYGRYGPTDRPYPKSALVESIRIERAAAPVAAAGADANPEPPVAQAR